MLVFEGEPTSLWGVTVEAMVGTPIDFSVIASYTSIEPVGHLEKLIEDRQIGVCCDDAALIKPEANLHPSWMGNPVGGVATLMTMDFRVAFVKLFRQRFQDAMLLIREVET